MSNYKLEMKSISKRFANVLALDGADFNLKTGEVHALLGINGAGKSTLIKILSGVYTKDEGVILLNGKQITINRPNHSIKHGITTVYQDSQMINSFTAYENIYLGMESDKSSFLKSFTINRAKLRMQAETLLAKFPIAIDLDKPLRLMEAVEKEIVAILRALSMEMSILILDEPTSILTEKEAKILFNVIDMLKQKGVSIIFITHRLEEVNQIADRITVFRNGKNVATLDIRKEGIGPQTIAELMLGKKFTNLYPDKGYAGGDYFFEVEELSLEGIFDKINFRVEKGKIFGIYGLLGSGIDELSKAIFGAFGKTEGRIKIHGREAEIKSPTEAIKNGIYLITGDRRNEGIIGKESICFNMSLSNLKRVKNILGLVKRPKENSLIAELVNKLEIDTPNLKQRVELLSGGNQQKVVIGKGLFTDAKVYIFTEPTVGVDVGAKAAIYKLMRDLSFEAAVIIISSDCEEIYGMADQVMVIYKGQVSITEEIDKIDMQTMVCNAVASR